MAGLLGYAMAGGMTGYGNSLVEDAKAKREAAMETLRNDRLIAREDRQYERQLGRDEASRSFTREENEANRAQQGRSTATGADGVMHEIHNGTATPIAGPDGQGFKPARSSGDRAPPADVATAEWLIQNNVAKDAADAWDRVRKARTSETGYASLVAGVYKSMAGDIADRRPDAEKRRDARAFVDELLREEEGPRSDAATQSTLPDAPPPSTQSSGATAYPRASPAKPNDKAAYDALPSGSYYIVPETGELKVKR